MDTQTNTKGPGPVVMGSKALIGQKVYNSAGEHLGDAEDIVIDAKTGKVAYAVLSFGGFLGMGEKLFAIPWSAFSVNTDNKHVILNVDKEKLKKAPGFNKKEWPTMAELTWANNIHTYYGSQPYWH